MSDRERERDRHEDPPVESPPAASSGDGVRNRASRLLEEGDEAIRRALSGDSQRFLTENRQHPGE